MAGAWRLIANSINPHRIVASPDLVARCGLCNCGSQSLCARGSKCAPSAFGGRRSQSQRDMACCDQGHLIGRNEDTLARRPVDSASVSSAPTSAILTRLNLVFFLDPLCGVPLTSGLLLLIAHRDTFGKSTIAAGFATYARTVRWTTRPCGDSSTNANLTVRLLSLPPAMLPLYSLRLRAGREI